MEQNKRKLYLTFKQKLEQVSGECYDVKTLREVRELISKILMAKGVRQIALDPGMRDANLTSELLHKNGFTVYSENLNQVASQVDAGITEIRWAISELGTLVQDGTDVNQRLCSALPPIHVAVVQASALVSSLMDALKIIHELPQMPGFLGFITGPSRTSDIERVLTIGVHGPEQLIVIFVDEPGEVD